MSLYPCNIVVTIMNCHCKYLSMLSSKFEKLLCVVSLPCGCVLEGEILAACIMLKAHSHTYIWSVRCNRHMIQISSSCPTHHFKSFGAIIIKAATQFRVTLSYYCCLLWCCECTYCSAIAGNQVCFKFNESLWMNFKPLSEKGYSNYTLYLAFYYAPNKTCKQSNCLSVENQQKRKPIHNIMGS